MIPVITTKIYALSHTNKYHLVGASNVRRTDINNETITIIEGFMAEHGYKQIYCDRATYASGIIDYKSSTYINLLRVEFSSKNKRCDILISEQHNLNKIVAYRTDIFSDSPIIIDLFSSSCFSDLLKIIS